MGDFWQSSVFQQFKISLLDSHRDITNYNNFILRKVIKFASEVRLLHLRLPRLHQIRLQWLRRFRVWFRRAHFLQKIIKFHFFNWIRAVLKVTWVHELLLEPVEIILSYIELAQLHMHNYVFFLNFNFTLAFQNFCHIIQ